MVSGSREKSVTSVDDMPIDAEAARDTVDSVLGMRLDASTRQDIDVRTGALVSLISELLTTDLGAERDDKTMALYRACYYLLDMKRRPTRESPAYYSFEFMRECALRTRALLELHVEKNGAKVT